MTIKKRENETLEEKVARIKRKAERQAAHLGAILNTSQNEAAAKLKAKGVELLDTLDELLGDDDD